MADKYIDGFNSIDGGLNHDNLILMFGSGDTVNATLGAVADYVNSLHVGEHITGGTYNPVNGIATFTNDTGGTFNVTGFLTGYTDTAISAFTYDNANEFKIDSTNGSSFSVNINSLTGLTINGSLNVTGSTNLDSIYVNTLSATTYQNLPLDIHVTGVTYSQGSLTLTRQDGSISTPILPDWLTSTDYKTKDLVIGYYQSEYRLFRALSNFTSSGVNFPGTQTIATDLNSYVGQWQEVSPLRGSMGNMTFNGSISYSSTLTPPVLTGPTNTTFNNYSPTGLANTNFLRISSTNNVNIDGLLAPIPLKNQGLYICNVGTHTITIKDDTGSSSTVTNRFLLGSDKNLQANEGIMLIYDDISLRWRSEAIQI